MKKKCGFLFVLLTLAHHNLNKKMCIVLYSIICVVEFYSFFVHGNINIEYKKDKLQLTPHTLRYPVTTYCGEA